MLCCHHHSSRSWANMERAHYRMCSLTVECVLSPEILSRTSCLSLICRCMSLLVFSYISFEIKVYVRGEPSYYRMCSLLQSGVSWYTCICPCMSLLVFSYISFEIKVYIRERRGLLLQNVFLTTEWCFLVHLHMSLCVQVRGDHARANQLLRRAAALQASNH